MNDHSSLDHRHPVSSARRRATLLLRFILMLALIAVFAVVNKTPSRVRAMTPAETAAFKEFISYWETQDICWKATTTRGVGTIPTECPGKDKDAGLCYDKCPAGMYGVGPVCWQECPAGFTNTGAHCTKPGPYGRGAGYPWQFGDALNDSGMFTRCEKDNGKGNCEKNGAVVYPKCKANFHAVGCCTCSPDCPTGMTDIGVSCQKQSQGRGVGKPMTCRADQDYDAGLCYSKCAAGSTGVGPVCWASCPAGFPFNCGAACAKEQRYCGTAIAEMVLSTGQVALNVGVLIATAGSSAAGQASVKGAVAAAKVSAQAIGKKAVAEGAVALARNAIRQNATKIGVTLTVDALSMASRSVAQAKEDGTFDWTVLDPTGIAEVVKAFNKPTCGK